MTGTIVRCCRRLPGPRVCGTPLRWSELRGWHHDPTVTGETWDDHAHTSQYLHTPTPPDWAPGSLQIVEGSRGAHLAVQGRAIKRRGST